MKLDKQRWDVMNGILDELLELPEHQRLDKLRDYCSIDSTLFNDIAALLQECAADDSLLDQNALNLAHTLFDQLAPASLSAVNQNALQNHRVGAYILKREIGRGGMGVVYQAQRSQGDFAQTVAIKLLLNVTVAVSERFRREQQALAALNHPNITQLLDAGVTEQGLPYLIMEYIEGVPITDYCAAGNLTLAQRLNLLDQVAQALAFSHKNLIVHRDIKPSNILVTGIGQVKLLDFSIAKLLDTQWAIEETATHLHLLTPSYSAPEQVLNQPITVATDIYQLGLLYYRILTGRSPLTANIASLHELVAIVCNSEVTRPSTALLTAERLEEALPNPQEVGKLLSGDLDAIILKMLRKEPAARYQSIEAVRADIYAYQHNLPVAAHNAALSYRTGKYLKRNWRTLALASLASVSLAVYAVSMKMQNTRVQAALAKAQVEQHKAEQVAQFLTQTFEAADPNKGGLKGITAYDLLENARTKINEDLKDLPDVQAPLLNIFSKIYFRQQEYAKAETLLANLLNNPKAAEQLDKKLLAETQVRLAQQKIGQGQLSEAEKLLRSSLEIQKNTVAVKQPGNPLYGEALTLLGHCLYNQKHRQEADELTRQAINYLKNLGEAGDRVRAIALNSLANSQFTYDDLDGAIENMREALALRKKVLGDDHTETSNFQLFLARMLLDREEYDEAEALVKSAHVNLTKKLPSAHPYFSVVAGTLARLAQRRGQIDEAERIITEQIKGVEIEKLSSSQGNIYMYLLDIMLDQDKAEAVLKEVARLAQMPPFKSTNVQSRLALYEGRAFLLLNKPQEALNSLDKALALNSDLSSEASLIQRERAVALFVLGKYEETHELLQILINRLDKLSRPVRSQQVFVCRLLYLVRKEERYLNLEPPCSQPIKYLNNVYIPLHIRRWL